MDFEGAYTGVDFKERFNAVSTKHIDVNFIECDVHLFNSQELYNAIISVSALEHISNPEKLAKNSILFWLRKAWNFMPFLQVGVCHYIYGTVIGNIPWAGY